MQAVVLGTSGLVGSHLVESGSGSGANVVGTNRTGTGGFQRLEIPDAPEVKRLLAAARPNVVFLAAADANVDRCERDPATAAKVNVEAPRALATICGEMGALLVYYSTDYIFDGTAGPYDEEDRPNPICVYGSQKAMAEASIRESLPESHLILRTTVVYGNEPAGKNFLIRLLQNLRTQTSIRVPTDQIGSPTLVDDLADASWDLVRAGARGTFNVAGSERMDRHAFAVLAAQAFRLDAAPIVGVPTSDLDQLASRPLSAGLRVEKVETFLGRPMVGASAGLAMLARSGTL
jgi:dTDP-4-dehydrorhamnose reductase